MSFNNLRLQYESLLKAGSPSAAISNLNAILASGLQSHSAGEQTNSSSKNFSSSIMNQANNGAPDFSQFGAGGAALSGNSDGSAPNQMNGANGNLGGNNQVKAPSLDDIDAAQGELDRNGQHHPIAEFLYQLTKMLTDDNSEIIEWSDGRIKVHYPERLEGEVLHKYFRHSKFASFQRQLNYFGFRKIAGKGKMSPCSYVNDAATSDIRSLLLIKRKTNGSAARKAAMQQRAAALAGSTLNPFLQFPGAAAALANNPAALASLANPQALSGAMALLSDNALRAGLLGQQQGGNPFGAAGNPQLGLLALQQQQLLQQQQQQSDMMNPFKNQQQDLQDPMAQLQQQQQSQQANAPGPNSSNNLQQMQSGLDQNAIAQQHQQQLQQLQAQLRQLQEQTKTQEKLAAAATAAASGNNSGGENKMPSLNGSIGSLPLPKETSSGGNGNMEQLLAARFAAQNGAPAAGSSPGLGAASAALELQQQQNQKSSSGGSSDNPASAALQQQFSLNAATAALDADASAGQSSNNLFESALNLKSLLQEHQAAGNNPEGQNGGAQGARAGLMNRLPSSNTIFPSVASFGNLLSSSNRLSSLLSLSSFVGGPGGNGGVNSRDPSLADLAAAVGSVGNMANMPINAAALAALQQQHNKSAQNYRLE